LFLIVFGTLKMMHLAVSAIIAGSVMTSPVTGGFTKLGEGECRQADGGNTLHFRDGLEDLTPHTTPGNAEKATERCLARCAQFTWCLAAQVVLRTDSYMWRMPECHLVTDRPTFERSDEGAEPNYRWFEPIVMDGVRYITYCYGGSPGRQEHCHSGNNYASNWGGGSLYEREGYFCYKNDDAVPIKPEPEAPEAPVAPKFCLKIVTGKGKWNDGVVKLTVNGEAFNGVHSVQRYLKGATVIDECFDELTSFALSNPKTTDGWYGDISVSLGETEVPLTCTGCTGAKFLKGLAVDGDSNGAILGDTHCLNKKTCTFTLFSDPTESPTESPTDSPTLSPIESPTQSPTEPTEPAVDSKCMVDGRRCTTCVGRLGKCNGFDKKTCLSRKYAGAVWCGGGESDDSENESDGSQDGEEAKENALLRLVSEHERQSKMLNTAEEFCVFGVEASICDLPCAEVKHEIEEFLPEGLLDVCDGTDMTISDICSTECAVFADFLSS